MDQILTKRRVFVGSSTEGKGLAEIVIAEMRNTGLSPLVWFDFFQNDRPPMQELEHLTLQADAAVLVATPDDQAIIRSRKWHQARDNVLFEYGLFAGALGRAKCGLLVPDRIDFRIPSDFLGVACFELYTERTTQAAAATVAAALAAAVSTPPTESVQSRSRRMLQLIGWIRDEALRLVQDWDSENGKHVISNRIIAVSAFIRDDIDSLGLRSEYNTIERIVLEAVDTFPEYREPFNRSDMEHALHRLVAGVQPHPEVWRGLLSLLERQVRDLHYGHPPEHCPRCYEWLRHRGYPHPYDRYPYSEPYWPYRERGYADEWLFCGPLAWAAGAAEMAGIFGRMLDRADMLRPIKEWSKNIVPRLNESVAAFERRLHETIFGVL